MSTVQLIVGGILIVCGAALIYALGLRPWLKKQSWAQTFFDKIEPAEIALFKKSETILVGRLVWLGSAIVTIYDGITKYFTSLNWEPLTTRVMDFLHIPPDMRPTAMGAAMIGLGLAIVKLRKNTTKPVELVAVPEAKLPPEAVQALANADAAKVQAVQAVTEAKT